MNSFTEALATILSKVEVTETPHTSMVTKEMTRSLQEQLVATLQSDLAKVTIHSVVAILGLVTSTYKEEMVMIISQQSGLEPMVKSKSITEEVETTELQQVDNQ